MKILAIFLAASLHALVGLSTDAQSKSAATAAATRTDVIVARDGLVYVGQTGGMVIRDVSDPTRPVDLSWLPLPSTVSDIVIDDSIAFLAAGTRGLVIADISDPENPVERARLDTDGKVKRIARTGKYMFLADGVNGLLVVDLSSLDDPRICARISTSGDLRAVAISGELLAIAEGHGGARVFSLRRPDNPRELKRLDARFSARDVCWIEDRLFVAAGSKGTAVYEPRTSARPLMFLPPVRSAQHVSCSENLLAVSNLGSAIQLFDVEDPPQERSRLRIHRSAPIGRAGFDGTRLWIATDVAGMGMLDVADADNPVRVLPRAREFKVNY
jgi:hypothetical protein